VKIFVQLENGVLVVLKVVQIVVKEKFAIMKVVIVYLVMLENLELNVRCHVRKENMVQIAQKIVNVLKVKVHVIALMEVVNVMRAILVNIVKVNALPDSLVLDVIKNVENV
jgi:hypothetical protein